MEWLKRFYMAFEDYLAGGLLFIGLSMIFVNVALRYFWGNPQSILDEFSVYFIVWGTLVGIAVALRNDNHIKVDLLYGFLPLIWKYRVSIFANLVGLAFCVFYTYYGVQLELNYIETGMRSSNSRFPLWAVYLIIPISGVMFGLRFVDKLYGLLKRRGRDWFEAARKGV